jgi:hypothetical protein
MTEMTVPVNIYRGLRRLMVATPTSGSGAAEYPPRGEGKPVLDSRSAERHRPGAKAGIRSARVDSWPVPARDRTARGCRRDPSQCDLRQWCSDGDVPTGVNASLRHDYDGKSADCKRSGSPSRREEPTAGLEADAERLHDIEQKLHQCGVTCHTQRRRARRGVAARATGRCERSTPRPCGRYT